LVSEKLYMKVSRNCTGQIANTLKSRREATARRREPGGQRLAHTPPRRGPAPGRAWPTCGRLLPPPTPPLRLFIPLLGKTLSTRSSIHEKFRRRRKVEP
jgi:hypothetical protein